VQGEVEVSVLFAPTREEACAATAWCQLEGRPERLPLALCGQGLGPQARLFSFTAPCSQPCRLACLTSASGCALPGSARGVQRGWPGAGRLHLHRRRRAVRAQTWPADAGQASFAFDCLDVKDALVGAPYLYEADLMNRRAAQGPVSHT